MYIVVAMMTASACTDPFADVPKPPTTGNNQIQTTEFHTSVTMWLRNDDYGFVGLVSTIPHTDLSKAEFYAVQNGQKIFIASPYATNIPAYREMYEGYLWANVHDNVLMLYFNGGPSSTPPFPLDIVIVY